MRVITEELIGVGWDVIWEDAPDVDERGQQKFTGKGERKTKRVAVIVFTDMTPGQMPRITKVGLDEDNRKRLAEKLLTEATISIHQPGEVPRL